MPFFRKLSAKKEKNGKSIIGIDVSAIADKRMPSGKSNGAHGISVNFHKPAKIEKMPSATMLRSNSWFLILIRTNTKKLKPKSINMKPSTIRNRLSKKIVLQIVS